MINIKKLKQQLKVTKKKKELANDFYIAFETNITGQKKQSRFIKTQYLQSPFVKIKNKKEIKFPLNTVLIPKIENITYNLQAQNIYKLNSVVISNKKIITNLFLKQNKLLNTVKLNLNNSLKTLQVFKSLV